MKKRVIVPGVWVHDAEVGDEVHFDTPLGKMVVHFSASDVSVSCEGTMALVVRPTDTNRVQLRTEPLFPPLPTPHPGLKRTKRSPRQ